MEVRILYIYPDNLKAAPTLWLWRLRDIAIGGLLAVFGVAMLAQLGLLLFAAIAALYLFLTIRFEDACILDFIRKAGVYFLIKPQFYRWGSPFQIMEVKRNQKAKPGKKAHKAK